MALKAKLKEDLTVALKSGDKLTVSVLRDVIGTVDREEKAGKVAVIFTDDEVLNVIKRLKKRREATVEEYYTAPKYKAQADRELAEAAVLETYLPVQLSVSDLNVIVANVIKDNPDANFGLIMKHVMGIVKGQADGATVKAAVEANLR